MLQYVCVVVYAGCAITPDSNGHVDIPSSWTEIGVYAFSYCTSLVSVTIPDSVVIIQYAAFEGNSNLETVTIKGAGLRFVLYGAFYQCNSLTSLNLPNSVTSIGTNAFSSSGLASITIPPSVTSIGSYGVGTSELFAASDDNDGVTPTTIAPTMAPTNTAPSEPSSESSSVTIEVIIFIIALQLILIVLVSTLLGVYFCSKRNRRLKEVKGQSEEVKKKVDITDSQKKNVEINKLARKEHGQERKKVNATVTRSAHGIDFDDI